MKKLILLLIIFFICFGISIPISADGCTTEVGKVESRELNSSKLDSLELKSLSLTKDNVLYVMKTAGLHHTDVVMKQVMLETGHLTSKLAKCGNLFGLRGKHGYYHYRHWSESIFIYRDKIQSRYKNGENYYSFLKRIKYCKSSKYIKLVQNTN